MLRVESATADVIARTEPVERTRQAATAVKIIPACQPLKIYKIFHDFFKLKKS
jgi:hypothetical protein